MDRALGVDSHLGGGAEVIWLMAALAGAPPSPPGRLITLPWLHLGARVHVLVSPDEAGVAATVQLTI